VTKVFSWQRLVHPQSRAWSVQFMGGVLYHGLAHGSRGGSLKYK
jgi:hypothetical protein